MKTDYYYIYENQHVWEPTDFLKNLKLIPNQVLSRLKKCEKCPTLLHTSLRKVFKNAGQNHLLIQTGHILNFLHPILMCRVTYWAPLGLRHLRRAVNPSHFLTIGSNCWSLKSLVSLGVLEKIYLVTWNCGPISASDRITKDAHMTTYFLLMRTWRGSASGPEINAQGRW